MNDTTLGWKDILQIGRELWDDVTRCRLAAGDWGVGLAIHPGFGGPQSVVLCGDHKGGFIESAMWRKGLERPDWLFEEIRGGGALVSRGPLTVWRQSLDVAETGQLRNRVLDLGIASMNDATSGDGPLVGMRVQVYFRHGSYDHAFAIGEGWRSPPFGNQRALLSLFVPHLKPSLRLYFSDS